MNRRLSTCKSASQNAGYAGLEVLVGATLTLALIASFSTLAFRIRGIDRSTLDYQAATQELANHVARISALDREEARTALENIEVDEDLSSRLPGTRLVGQWIDDSEGTRFLIELDWDRAVPAQPIRMVAWVKEEAQ
jgi:hypothetical protein